MQKSHYDASIDYLITIKYSFKGESIMTEMQQYVEDVLAIIQRRDPEQTEFQNAAREVLTSLVPMLEKEPKYKQHHILERIIFPGDASSFSASPGKMTTASSTSTAATASRPTAPSALTKAACASTRAST